MVQRLNFSKSSQPRPGPPLSQAVTSLTFAILPLLITGCLALSAQLCSAAGMSKVVRCRG